MQNFKELLIKIRQNHCNWENNCIDKMPNLVDSRRVQYTRISVYFSSLWIHAVISIVKYLISNKPSNTYIFEGLRHRAIIELLPAAEVMVLGGRNEFLYCMNKGYRFHWSGYIVKSFQLYIWGHKEKPLSKAILCIQKIFANHIGKKRYLFLFEDSLPVGMTLSACLKAIPELNIVCIMHGVLGVPEISPLLPEGLTCKFNLVWDQNQVKNFECKNEPNSATFVLGLPYEVLRSQHLSHRVVLVGHDGIGNDFGSYFYTLYHFCKVFRLLKKAGFDVAFRPHPQDDLDFVSRVFPVLCLEDKFKLFSSGRMVFIGFYSSLLYEARQFGNVVISLDASPLPDRVELDVDCLIPEFDYDKLPERIFDLLDARSSTVDVSIESLSSRFYRCLQQIDEFNTKLNQISND
jgi:hypothetical protein